MLSRTQVTRRIKESLKANSVTALLGPRQCGKTTVARMLASFDRASYFDLEDPTDLARLQNPMAALSSRTGLVVIDEIQRAPDLFPVLRVLADRRSRKSRFLILGSASPEMIRRSSETLAGRVGFVDMGGFGLDEVGAKFWKRLWLRGGFPRSYLAGSEHESSAWRENFVRTFLERDLPQLGIRVSAVMMRKFWTMLAHYHGQRWNGSEIGGSLGVAHTTVQHHLYLLTGALVIRQLPPWFENLGKRVVKSPKVYVRDSGLLHSLLRIGKREDLESHPKLGASWEGFVVEEILKRVGERDAYYWATHGGGELDLMILRSGKRFGFEIKFADAPTATASMRSALKDLRLERLWVVHPGRARYSPDKDIEVIGLADLEKILTGWKMG
jgi:uncharacterized protein